MIETEFNREKAELAKKVQQIIQKGKKVVEDRQNATMGAMGFGKPI